MKIKITLRHRVPTRERFSVFGFARRTSHARLAFYFLPLSRRPDPPPRRKDKERQKPSVYRLLTARRGVDPRPDALAPAFTRHSACNSTGAPTATDRSFLHTSSDFLSLFRTSSSQYFRVLPNTTPLSLSSLFNASLQTILT